MNETAEQVEARSLPLEEAHARGGATLAARYGWLVPVYYGDAGAVYDSVRGGGAAGLFDLTPRGRVGVSGREAVQFLNGLVTNDVKALAPGASMLAALPSPQGRLLAFARVARPTDEESFLFDTEPATRASVFRSLERFALAGDFKVRDLTEETAQLSLQGARSAEIVAALFGGEAARVARGRVLVSTLNSKSVTLARATHTAEDGFDLIAGASDARALWDALVAAGARPAGDDVLEVLRVEAGVPRYGVDVSEANVVLEAGLDEAVSYTKGCYVGQEIIARIHWRGHVAKRLAGLLLEDAGEGGAPGGGGIAPEVGGDGIGVASADSLARGPKIKSPDGAREIGRVTSSVFSPRLRRRIALGVIKYEFLAPGTEVMIESGGGARRASVAALPFVRGTWYEDASESAT